ncbi:MAG: PilZ domain-containing protein [Gammaproteobacteria bacterium SHHR-1]|uniref:PilZ domain-containing protein n=1 Tax=Magnetovirga frankeli TaxID=947516 RepID=UPI0012937507|nr:PilZ domain-containing protein [gamma proteobacterium SS-5]
MDTDENRRTFFRIEDRLQISYKRIGPDELSELVDKLYRDELDHFSVASEIMALRTEAAPLMRQISSQSADIANYLSSLDQRLELLARTVAARDSDLTEHPPRDCNLSASGIAIGVDQPLQAGEMLEVSLLLLPSYAGVRAIAEVVDCTPSTAQQTEAAYQLRLNFSHMREKDRDLLIKHIIQRQGEMLRKRREDQYS